MESISGEKLFEVALSTASLCRVRRRSRRRGRPDREARRSALRSEAGRAPPSAAEMVGAAARMLDIAVEHARTRVQSGRPIGSFQAIQHPLCRHSFRHVDSARYLVQRAAWRAPDTGQPRGMPTWPWPRPTPARPALAVARKARQVLGAIGYCEEHVLHRLHKQIIAARLAYGDTRHHAETIARSIGLGGERPICEVRALGRSSTRLATLAWTSVSAHLASGCGSPIRVRLACGSGRRLASDL